MKKEEILAICIEEIRSGKSTVEDCIARYPEFGKELQSLLKIASSLKMEIVKPSVEFKQRAKRRLFEVMQSSPEKPSQRIRIRHKLLPAGWVAGVLIGLFAFCVAGAGTVYAAQGSLPGDFLYPVKTGVEDLQLAITPGTEAKADLHLKLAQRRIDEATRQVELNRDINVNALETVKQQFDDAINELSSSNNTEAINNTLSRLSAVSLDQQVELEQILASAPQNTRTVLKQIIGIARRGNTIAQVAYADHNFLKYQPSVADEGLEAGQFQIEGNLLSIQDNNWNVSGTIIRNVHVSGQVPAIGSRVKLEGLVKDDNVFISRIETSENSPEPSKLEGQFRGTSQNGTSDISGIQVKIGNEDDAQLKPGDNVQLQSDANDEKLNVTRKESNKDDSTSLSGTLTEVHRLEGTIVVKMTGNQVTVNVSRARIENKNDDRQTFELSDLDRLIGQDVKLEGLYKKSDSLYASRVQIEAEK
jgi:hypothetical protein